MQQKPPRPPHELPKQPTRAQVANLAAKAKLLCEELQQMCDALRLHHVDADTANNLQREAMLLVRDSAQLALSLRPSIAQLSLPKVPR